MAPAAAVLVLSGGALPSDAEVSIRSGETVSEGPWTFSDVQPTGEDSLIVQAQRKAKPPRLRTHLMVCLTAAFIVVAVALWRRA